jgi:hypothetical protein
MQHAALRTTFSFSDTACIVCIVILSRVETKRLILVLNSTPKGLRRTRESHSRSRNSDKANLKSLTCDLITQDKVPALDSFRTQQAVVFATFSNNWKARWLYLQTQGT